MDTQKDVQPPKQQPMILPVENVTQKMKYSPGIQSDAENVDTEKCTRKGLKD